MNTYKKVLNVDDVPVDFVQRLFDNAFIPFCPDNTDFQEYQRWLAEGNEPEPADATPVADTQGEQ